MASMKLVDLISNHKDELIGKWARKVVERLGLQSTELVQLINALPHFLDEIIECLDRPPETWRRSDGAEAHGVHRIETGLDIGALAEEFALVEETIYELVGEHGLVVTPSESANLIRFIGRGTAESVRAYARLRDRQLAEEASRHFSFVAHELRTPLMTARLAVHLISEDKGNSAMHLQRLQRAHDQLSDLVDNSLVEARLQGQPRMQLERCQTGALMQEAVTNARTLAWRKAIELSSEGDDVEILVDRKLLVSALTNLIANAVKFSRDTGAVRVMSRLNDDRVLFEIEDECGGLPEDLPARLFQPFVQAGADRTGFGLGLLIVKQAVEAHGGAVRVVNCPPKGCCFVVELPRQSLESGRV
jgi:signal transduction histidine kinase